MPDHARLKVLSAETKDRVVSTNKTYLDRDHQLFNIKQHIVTEETKVWLCFDEKDTSTDVQILKEQDTNVSPQFLSHE